MESSYETPHKMIGYARVSTRGQDTSRQEQDLLAAGVRPDDLYVDQGISGRKATRPGLDAALAALQPHDTLVITTLDRLGRSTMQMLELAEELSGRGVALRVLNLGGGVVDTSSPTGRLMFTVMTALAQMEVEIKRERLVDSLTKRRSAGQDLGGRRPNYTDSQIRACKRLIDAGELPSVVAKDFGMSRATLYRRLAKLDQEPAGAA